jgi:hypothetical protein
MRQQLEESGKESQRLNNLLTESKAALKKQASEA